MKYLFSFFILIHCCTLLIAQGEGANLTFGINCCIYINSDSLEEFQTPMESYEASASISDGDGTLIFYTNGKKKYTIN